MGEFSYTAAALKTPTRNGYNAQGVNLNLHPPKQMNATTYGNKSTRVIHPAPGLTRLFLPVRYRGTQLGRPALPPRRPSALRTMTPTPLTLTTVIQMLLLTAATSFEHSGPQCLLTLTRSTSPTTRSVPSARVLVSPLYYEPSVRYKKTRRGDFGYLHIHLSMYRNELTIYMCIDQHVLSNIPLGLYKIFLCIALYSV